jgi:Mg-chelatase subunit ChlD
MRALFRARLVFVALLCGCVALADGLRVTAVDTSNQNRLMFVVEPPLGTPQPSADQFMLREDGREAGKASRVQRFAETDRPVALMIVVDVSQSMRKVMTEVRNGVIGVIDRVAKPNNRIGLMTFGAGIEIVAEPGASREDLRAAAELLEAEHSTTLLYQALDEAVTALAGIEPSIRKRVIVITDGKDELVGRSIEDFIERQRAASIPVDAAIRGVAPEQFAQGAARIADRTGGMFVYARQGQLNTELTKILDNIDNTPVVSFDRRPDWFGRTTKNVGLTFAPGGQVLPWEANMVIPASSSLAGLPVWVYVAGVVLLFVIGAILWWYTKPRKAQEREDRIPVKPTDGIPVPPPPVVVPPKPVRPPRRGKTDIDRSGVIDTPAVDDPADAEFRTLFLEPVGKEAHRGTVAVEANATVGAGSRNTIQIPNDEFVSSDHARFYSQNGQMFVEDLNSTNGTYINDTRIHRATAINPGDTVRFGHTSFRVTKAQARHAGTRFPN